MASRSVKSQWTNAGVLAATSVVMFVLNRDDGGLGSLVFPGLLLVLAIAASPLLKRTSVPHDTAVASDSEVVIYHRPGCTYCIRMKALLGPTGYKAAWVDIWDDEEAAAFVRSVNNGDETVPTVVVDGTAHTNPSPTFVREALAGVA